MLKVLVVDDDAGLRLAVKAVLQNAPNKFQVEEAFDGIDALEKVKAGNFDVVILDVDMPRMDGLEALRKIKEFQPGMIVMMLTAHATIDHAVLAVKEGAYNYLSKPVQGDTLVALLNKAVEAYRLISSVAASAPVLLDHGRKIIGNTAQMQKVFNIIFRLSKVDTPVLIRGSSGTGKELVARAIHFNSARKDEKFVAINCSAVPENLFESEFFGHEKGSFTGADQRKIGKFQFAEGGTLFLDEIGDLPLAMQVKLLRVLQEKTFTPVGSLRDIQTNVRIIAATNRPLEEMIKAGTFRDDLFYRLNVIPIFLPPLSERRGDLETMVCSFIKKFNQIHQKRISGVTPDAMNILKKYDWPGNIRELENVIEHAFIMENSNLITVPSLSETVLVAVGVNLLEINSFEDFSVKPLVEGATGLPDTDLPVNSDETSEENGLELDDNVEVGANNAAVDPQLDFNLQKEAFEKEFIIKALKLFKGRINQTALHANIPKKTLLRKIEKYGIIAKEYNIQ
jgi:DNA-binding NtrC family response regulator